MTADVENDGDRGHPWGERVPPPKRRPNLSTSAHLEGHNVHVTIDLHDGRAVAIAVEINKEGSVFRSLLHCVAELASDALQRGAPIGEVVGMLRNVRFEPSGMVSGHEAITHATSIVDLVGQLVAHEFPEAP